MSLLSTSVLAAAEHSNPLIPEANELIWGTVSFLVLLVIVGWKVFPRINASFKNRTEAIEGNIEKAERERQEAQQLLEQYRAKLQEANAESRQILEQARSNADRLEAELRAKAEQEAARIVERARAAVATERDRAIDDLRGEVGTLAVDLASRVVGEALDEQRHRQLIDQFIDEIRSPSTASVGQDT